MTVDFAFTRFRLYLVGAPNGIIIVTAHSSLLSVFNGKRNGSIRAERIKLRHQDIRFLLQYKKGIINPADHLSRLGIPCEALSKNEKNEFAGLTNLLYTLRVTQIFDVIGIKEIAEETNNDLTLQDLRDIIRSGKLYIPTNKPHLTPYKQIISEIRVLNNGTLLKQDKIILPNSLHEKVIRLTHNESHPEQNALKRCLRNHFYIKDLGIKLTKYVRDCSHCQMFIESKLVPEKC